MTSPLPPVEADGAGALHPPASRRWRKHPVMAVAATLLVSLTATGCGGPVACPAIGWSNEVGVALTGEAGAVATVEVCSDGVCFSGPLELQTAEPMMVETLGPQDLAGSTPSTVSPWTFSVAREDERTWRISTEMATPDSLTVRALSATGEVLAERDVDLSWQRVGGTAECGGPGEAEPIALDIPS